MKKLTLSKEKRKEKAVISRGVIAVKEEKGNDQRTRLQRGEPNREASQRGDEEGV